MQRYYYERPSLARRIRNFLGTGLGVVFGLVFVLFLLAIAWGPTIAFWYIVFHFVSKVW